MWACLQPPLSPATQPTFAPFLWFRRGNVLSRCERLLSRTTSLFKWSLPWASSSEGTNPLAAYSSPGLVRSVSSAFYVYVFMTAMCRRILLPLGRGAEGHHGKTRVLKRRVFNSCFSAPIFSRILLETLDGCTGIHVKKQMKNSALLTKTNTRS